MFYSRKLGIRSVSPMGLLSDSHSLTEFIYDRRAYIPSHERASPGQYTVKSHIHIGIQDVGGGHLASDNLTGFLTFTLSYLVRNYLEDKHRLIKISRSFTTFQRIRHRGLATGRPCTNVVLLYAFKTLRACTIYSFSKHGHYISGLCTFVDVGKVPAAKLAPSLPY